MISADYPSPVTVNGFSCRNCSDVARAQRNVDPADPAGGPFGIAKPDKAKAHQSVFDRAAVDAAVAARSADTTIGARIDLVG